MALKSTSIKSNPELMKSVKDKYKEKGVKLYAACESLMLAYTNGYLSVDDDEYYSQVIESPRQYTVNIDTEIFGNFRNKCLDEGREYPWVLQCLLLRDYKMATVTVNRYMINDICVGEVLRV